MANTKITDVAIDNLACDLYEGSPRLSNLAEKLARIFGEAEALTFYKMMDDDVQNFWRGIAKQILEHSTQWKKNKGCACVLSKKELVRLHNLPRASI